MSMQAVMQKAPGGAETLYLDVVEKPVLNEGQLLVRVIASGINRADIMQREGKYPPPPGAPEILGLEVAGIVEDVKGPSRFRPGDEVFGLVAGGGYAEYAVLDSVLAIPKPDSLSWVEAASLPEAWMTAWFNLVEMGRLQRGETILIHAGASGVGAAATQLAGLLGATSIVSAGSEEKLAFCQQMGADHVFNYKQHQAFSTVVKEWGGADVILDPVAASYLAENIASLKRDGRLVVIGLMGGTQAQLNMGQVLVKRLSLIGSTLRGQPLEVKARLAQALEQTVLPAILSGLLRVTLDSTYPMSMVEEAHQYIEANQNLGKVVLTWFPASSGG